MFSTLPPAHATRHERPSNHLTIITHEGRRVEQSIDTLPLVFESHVMSELREGDHSNGLHAELKHGESFLPVGC